MTVLITGGTFGYYNGRKVIPITRADGPQNFDAQLERRLVEEDRIAIYVNDFTAGAPEAVIEDADAEVIEDEDAIDDDEAEDIEEGEIDLESLSVAELKELAREAGIKPVPKTKPELIAALEDSPELDVAGIE